VLNAGYDIGLLLLNFVGRLYLLQQQLKQKKVAYAKMQRNLQHNTA